MSGASPVAMSWRGSAANHVGKREILVPEQAANKPDHIRPQVISCIS
jgi:hypothetical protein